MKPIKANSYKDFQKELGKLQAEHYHLQSIFKVAPIGIALVVEEKIEFINDQFCSIMNCENNNLIGKNFKDVFPDNEEYERVFKKHSEEIKNEGICKIETKFRRQDGAIIDIYLSSTLLDPDDQSLGTTYTALDITDRKNTERKLHTQIEQNEQILKTTLDGYILTDTEGKIEDVNQSYCEMSGYSREELLQMNIREVELQLSDKRIEKMIRLGRDRFETKHKTKDGVILDLDVSVVVMNFVQGPLVAAFIRDITKQRKAEKELKKSEEKYRSFFEYNDAVILFINHEDQTIYFANEAAVKYYGYSKNELIGMKISNINIMHVDTIKTKMREARKKKQNYFVFKHKLANGEIRDVQIYQTKLYLNDQELFSIIVQDITDQKKAKEEIRKKEEQFHTVIEAAGDAIFVADFETSRILLVNKQACKTLGYSQKELLTKTIGDLDPEFDEQNHRKNIWANLDEGESITIEVLHKRKDGTVFPVEVRTGIIKYNGNKAVLGFARDISERKQAEKLLRESEEKYRLLTETSGDMILLQDLNGQILYINQTGLDFIGTTRSEIEGKLITEFISQEHIELMNKRTEQRLKGDIRTCHYEIGIKLNPDQVVPLEIISSPIIQDGNITSILVIARDITERKRTEIELKQYREKLEELVKKRTFELEEKNKELEKYNDMFIGREFRIKELKEKLKIFEDKHNDKKL
ncbi:diguanylate cyclase/phosphodiesterase (GGDEF & EAL domains) with PAS/PAC sensor(s) [hydrothermal vent metagenome]|uniref:Diguanylate cyclase/phosphodiesterase (GGDEF & EAL domains) with PAS/PAC sensor(S) n=1 Tax=hydrothermal vent metagenome TaxID=652676 RepID=A0A3B1D635_9ZZZZ